LAISSPDEFLVQTKTKTSTINVDIILKQLSVCGKGVGNWAVAALGGGSEVDANA